MTPGTRAVFTLSAKNDREQWREQPTTCTVMAYPRENYCTSLRAGQGSHRWETIMIQVDGEREPRPVSVKRYVGPA